MILIMISLCVFFVWWGFLAIRSSAENYTEEGKWKMDWKWFAQVTALCWQFWALIVSLILFIIFLP